MGRSLCAGGEGRYIGAEVASPEPGHKVVIILSAAIPRPPHGDAGPTSGVMMPRLEREFV